MRFEEALLLAGKGQLITRPGYGVSFAAIREGQAVYGHFIGETGFTDVRAYVFTDEDWYLTRISPTTPTRTLRGSSFNGSASKDFTISLTSV